MIAVGTLCYIAGASKCPGCVTLIGRVVTVTNSDGSGTYTIAPEMVCPQHGTIVDRVKEGNLIPIAPPAPAVDLTQSAHTRRLRKMGAPV